MLLLGLVETSLELVSEEMVQHSSVLRTAKARGKEPAHLLLDEAVFPKVVQALSTSEKRGRPDIAHRSLLIALDSVLAQNEQLQVFVHTIADQVIQIRPGTRLPRREARFVGLIEQLLQAGRVPQSGSPLLELYAGTLEKYLNELTPSRTIVLTPTGTPMTPLALAKTLVSEARPLVLVGGFAHGELSTRITDLANETVSLHPEFLPTSTIVGMIIHNLETALNLETDQTKGPE
ncbi:MAG: 16S rRNA methyltransferase [Promethearchaeota archaeon]